MVTMVTREDIALGVYLRQTTGDCMGIIAVVHRVGISLSGEWFFQLRYLRQPSGARRRAVSEWSVNLHEKDLVYFELIGTWLSAQALLTAGLTSLKPQKEPKVPVWMRGTGRLNQLRLFEDF